MSDMNSERTPQEELAHWHAELARVLKAAPGLTWPNLIDWAEEAEHFALKACTKSGRKRLAELEKTAQAAEAEVTRLNRELKRSWNAKLAEAQPKLAAMEKLAAAWQEEAERARKDNAVPADLSDVAEMRIWDALERPLTMEEVAEHIRILRGTRHLAVHAVEVASDTYKNVKQRITDVADAIPPSDTAVSGEWENGWDAAMHAVRNVLENKEPTT